MKLPKCFILAMLLVTEIKADMTDEGPQFFQERPLSPSLQKKPLQQQKYKEVILYLTPTQIRAIESGQATIEQHLTAQPDLSIENEKQVDLVQKQLQERQQYIIQQQISHHEYEEANIQQNFYNPKSKGLENHDTRTYIPIEEPNEEKLETEQKFESQNFQHTLENEQHPQSYSYIHFYAPGQKQNDVKIQVYYPNPRNEKQYEQTQVNHEELQQELQTAPVIKEKYQLKPYKYHTLNKQNTPFEQKDLYQKRSSNVENKDTFTPILQQQSLVEELFNPYKEKLLLNNKLQAENELTSFKYAPKYNGKKYTVDAEENLKNIHSDKELANKQIENMKNSPLVIVHKHVDIIKRRPVENVKHVKVPVPAPFLVPIPQPFQVKVPQPYPVPLEIIRHIPIPIVKTEKIEIERPVPIEIEKHVPIPIEKKVFVNEDKPYTVEKIVPVEIKKEIPIEIPIYKPEKLTILRHIWEH